MPIRGGRLLRSSLAGLTRGSMPNSRVERFGLRTRRSPPAHHREATPQHSSRAAISRRLLTMGHRYGSGTSRCILNTTRCGSSRLHLVRRLTARPASETTCGPSLLEVRKWMQQPYRASGGSPMRVVALEEHFTVPALVRRIDPGAISRRGFRPRKIPANGPNPVNSSPTSASDD